MAEDTTSEKERSGNGGRDWRGKIMLL